MKFAKSRKIQIQLIFECLNVVDLVGLEPTTTRL